jgi:hypothetical protein
MGQTSSGGYSSVTRDRKKRTAIAVAAGLALGALLCVLLQRNPLDFMESIYESMMIKQRLDLEELLGVVSITTFLLGFTSVRLQSTLEEHQSFYSRQVERVLEQNSNQDLLPFPSSFQQHKGAEDFQPWDTVTRATVILTWFLLAISTIFILWHQEGSVDTAAQFWWLQLIHFVIVLIGTTGPYWARRQFENFESDQPFPRFQQLEESLDQFLDPNDQKSSEQGVLAAVDNLDESIPEWCWLELIRGSLSPKEKAQKQQYLKRLHNLATPAKDVDEYSLIASVWSAYLIESDEAISRSVRASDLQRIMSFSRSRLSLSGRPEPYAELALREALKSRKATSEGQQETDMMREIEDHRELVKRQIKTH